MKKEVTTDALVTFEDALRWAEPLLKSNPDDLITRILAIEPAALGVAINVAMRTCQRIETRGVAQAHSEYVFNQMCLAGAIAIELMRHGNAKLWRDMIEPSEDGPKENDHE